MKVLAFILLAICGSEACLPVPVSVPKDYKFDCPAPNGKGLQDVFEKFPKLFQEFLPKLFGMIPASVSHVNRMAKTYLDISYLKREAAFKNFKSFVCENMHVDAEFYMSRFETATSIIESIHPFKANMTLPPKEKYREEFAKFAQFLRQSALGQGLDKLLKEAEASDTYAKVAMVFLNSPEFKALKKKALSSRPLIYYRSFLSYYNVNEDDVVYVFTLFSLSWWSRQT